MFWVLPHYGTRGFLMHEYLVCDRLMHAFCCEILLESLKSSILDVHLHLGFVRLSLSSISSSNFFEEYFLFVVNYVLGLKSEKGGFIFFSLSF